MTKSTRELTAHGAPEIARAANGADQLGGVLARIRRISSSLPASGRAVAAYIEAHPIEVVQSPIAELATAIGVSTTTIIRTTRALGFRGLRELKYALAIDAGRYEPVIETSVSKNDRAVDIARNVLQSSITALADTAAVLDDATLEAVVDALLTAGRIEFFGIGLSAAIASDGHFRLIRLGLPAGATLDAFMQLATAQLLGPGDVAFAISHFGRTARVLEVLKTARARGATTVLLTGVARSPMSRVADHVLLTSAQVSAVGSEAMMTRIAQLSILDALTVICALRRPEAMRRLRQWHAIAEDHRVDPE